MAREVNLMTIKEALSKNDKDFVRIRGRLTADPKSKTINGSNGDWTKILLQVEDETGKSAIEWCRPPSGVSLSAGDWIEAGPSLEGGKFGGCSIQEWERAKKVVAWGGRLKKIANPPASTDESASAPAAAQSAGSRGAISWQQAVAMWDAAWADIGTSAAPDNIAAQAAVELYKAALSGRVLPRPAARPVPSEPFSDEYDDIPFG